MAFAIITVSIVFRSIAIMELDLRPSLRAMYNEKEASGKSAREGRALGDAEPSASMRSRPDRQIMKDMWWMVFIGISIFLGGFGIWNLDNIYCSKLRHWRHQIGLPWGILLEGHGWWHLM